MALEWHMFGLPEPQLRNNLRDEAARRGVDPDRLVFAPPLPIANHLARFALASLMLDTHPCPQHTLASDALWAGVPVVTCIGETWVSRVAGSLLHAIGLPELVTSSLAEYERLALDLVRCPERLAQLRTRLAENRHTYPLFDTARYTRNLEAAIQEIASRKGS